jgi:hypothetical protein
MATGFNSGSIGPSANGTGTIALPTAKSGWSLFAQNQARADVVQQTSNSTTSCTLTSYGTTFAATNWTNGDPILVIAVGRRNSSGPEALLGETDIAAYIPVPFGMAQNFYSFPPSNCYPSGSFSVCGVPLLSVRSHFFHVLFASIVQLQT